MNFPNKSSIIFSAIIIVLISIIFIGQCSRDNQLSGIPERFDSTKIYKAEIEAIQKQGEAKINILKEDSLKTNIALIALKQENKSLRKKIVPARKEVEKIADTVAIVKRYLGLTDSLDVVQEATIDTLSAEKIRTWKNFNSIVSLKDDEIKLTNDLKDYYKSENEQLKKQVKRERLKKTFWKVATGIAVTGLVFSSFNN